jgi:hypothetical protein
MALCPSVASVRALECVRGGRAEVIDALRHSADGTTVIVTLEAATLVADRVLLCAELHDDLLPAAGWRVSSLGLEAVRGAVTAGPTAKRVVSSVT